MRHLNLVALATLAPALACSSVDITGFYKTTAAAADQGACSATTATTTPTYFVVREGELLGVTLVTIQGCTAQDLTTCKSAGTVSQAPLTSASGDGWEGQADGAAGFGGSPCTFSRTVVMATQGAELGLTVEATRREDERTTDTCDTDHVPDDLPCASAQRLVGERVGEAPPNEGGLTL